MEWISVEDRLPSIGQFLVYVNPALGVRSIEIGLRMGGVWSVPSKSNSSGKDLITHWMPLPEPPTHLLSRNKKC
jgi:hypothetical protein